MKSGQIRYSVSDLLSKYRDALIAVVPMAEHVRLPWRDPDAYDDWDAIASSLYEGLVGEVVRWSLSCCGGNRFVLPKYDIALEDYAGFSTIECACEGESLQRMVFLRFESESCTFDQAGLVHVSSSGKRLGDEITKVDWRTQDWFLRVDYGRGQFARLQSLQLQ